MNGRDLVAETCGQLASYLAVLEHLVAEPDAPPGGPAGMAPRPADPPEPWNGPAGRALMDSHEGVRRLEAALRYAITGHPGIRRGGSGGNTAAALAAIPRLAAGLGEDAEGAAARILDRWVNEARTVPAIDEAQRWRPLPRQPGTGLPPRCPYCRCYQLHVALDAYGRATTHIECFVPGCRDGSGYRPSAETGTDVHGRPVLSWADGTAEIAPDLDGPR